MNKVAENRPTESRDIAQPSIEDEDLIFVVMEAKEGGKVAIEGRYGIVAFADNIDDLKREIVYKMQEHFHGKFRGEVRVRQFVDEIITL